MGCPVVTYCGSGTKPFPSPTGTVVTWFTIDICGSTSRKNTPKGNESVISAAANDCEQASSSPVGTFGRFAGVRGCGGPVAGEGVGTSAPSAASERGHGRRRQCPADQVEVVLDLLNAEVDLGDGGLAERRQRRRDRGACAAERVDRGGDPLQADRVGGRGLCGVSGHGCLPVESRAPGVGPTT